MSNFKSVVSYFIAVALLFVASSVFAVPEVIDFQSKLLDSNGKPLTGEYDIQVGIYDTETGDDPLWEECHNKVKVGRDGDYAFSLGEINPLDKVPFDKQDLWIDVKVLKVSVQSNTTDVFNTSDTQPQSDTSLQQNITDVSTQANIIDPTVLADTQIQNEFPTLPRRKITSKAYALKAKEAEVAANALSLNGYTINDIVTKDFLKTTEFKILTQTGVVNQPNTINTNQNLVIEDVEGFEGVGNQIETTKEKDDRDIYWSPSGSGRIHNVNSTRVGIGLDNPNNTFQVKDLINFDDAKQSTALGSGALVESTGRFNTAVGRDALHWNKTGEFNTGVGCGALLSGLGNYNTAIGAQALSTCGLGSQNTAVGYKTLFSNMGSADLTKGLCNTGIGAYALTFNKEGNFNTAVGNGALHDNEGDANTAVGMSALYNTTGKENTAIGLGAGSKNTVGNDNTFIGYHADATSDNLTNSTAIGANAKVARSNAVVLGGTGDYAVNVGIGVEAPNNKLQVAELINFFNAGNATPTRSTAIGYRALKSLPGTNNTAIGYAPLHDNTSGINNTAIGTYALRYNEEGCGNTANGYNALFGNHLGNDNTAIGKEALKLNTASCNTATGSNALNANIAGANNTAIGTSSGSANIGGSSNTFIGYNANASSANLTNATAIGANAIVSSNNSLVLGDGLVKVGIGTNSPDHKLDVAGQIHSAAGGFVFPDNTVQTTAATSGSSYWDLNGENIYNNNNGNVGIGINTPQRKIDVSGLIRSSFGGFEFPDGTVQVTAATSSGSSYWALNGENIYNNNVGYVGIGTDTPNNKLQVAEFINFFNAGYGGDTIPNCSTAIGYGAIHDSGYSGNNNTALGFSTLFSDTTGNNNTATGFSALSANTTGNNNTATGSQALNANLSGYDNTATGFQALNSNISGYYNTATGYQSLYTNFIGAGDTATGWHSLYNNTQGSGNTANGFLALEKNTRGNCNVAFGALAGKVNNEGSYNTFIGYNANAQVGYGDLVNATAIGNGAIVDTSNKIVLGNDQITAIGGYANWSNYSDRRLKENIRPSELGLDFVSRLKPVRFNYKGQDKEHDGFIAQDIAETCKELGVECPALTIPGNPEKENYMLSLDGLVPTVVKALQEQQAQIVAQQKQIEQLKAEIAALKNK